MSAVSMGNARAISVDSTSTPDLAYKAKRQKLETGFLASDHRPECHWGMVHVAQTTSPKTVGGVGVR